MIRKLLCWLGWHEWEKRCYDVKYFMFFEYEKVCKHCGKLKR